MVCSSWKDSWKEAKLKYKGEMLFRTVRRKCSPVSKRDPIQIFSKFSILRCLKKRPREYPLPTQDFSIPPFQESWKFKQRMIASIARKYLCLVQENIAFPFWSEGESRWSGEGQKPQTMQSEKQSERDRSRSDGSLISHEQCEEGGGKTYDERARDIHSFVCK